MLSFIDRFSHHYKMFPKYEAIILVRQIIGHALIHHRSWKTKTRNEEKREEKKREKEIKKNSIWTEILTEMRATSICTRSQTMCGNGARDTHREDRSFVIRSRADRTGRPKNKRFHKRAGLACKHPICLSLCFRDPCLCHAIRPQAAAAIVVALCCTVTQQQGRKRVR